MRTMGQTDREELWYSDRQALLERVFTDASCSPEPLIRQLQANALPFRAAGLYGRTRDRFDRRAFLEAFREIFSCIALPELILLLIHTDADCRETAERAADWLREQGLTMNVAYLSGEFRLPEARQLRAAFEAAAANMFFRGAADCLPLESLLLARTAAEPQEEAVRRLRQEMAACLVRGEAGRVRERLEEYLRISAQGSPAMFREQCAGLYFRVNEELTSLGGQQAAYRQRLLRSGKTVFQLIEEANSAGEIRTHMSWYMDRLLEWYRLLRESAGRRVTAFVEEYIRNHYMESFAVEDLAAGIGLSANYVRSIFKNDRGQTIQSCLSEYRLEAACQLLRDTPASVGKVGQMVGFNNVSYFCASFQKRYGKTPGKWRRALYAEAPPGAEPSSAAQDIIVEKRSDKPL